MQALVVVAAVPIGLGMWVGSVQALTTKDIRGNCKIEYKKWLKRGGFGAFVLAKSGNCGFSWDADSPQRARQLAVSGCTKGRRKGPCFIVAENNRISKYVEDFNQCRAVKGQQSIDACDRLAASKRGSRQDRAGVLNNRGRTYSSLGKTDRALADYAAAIKIDKGYGWAHMNLAQLHRRQGDQDKAATEAKLALKYYRKGGDDYRAAAKALIEDIARDTTSLRAKPDDAICLTALKSDKSGFQDPGMGQAYVKEASRRQLSFEDCRLLLGYPVVVNPFETKTDTQLCWSALNSAGTAWDDSSSGQLAKSEAERRTFSVENCVSKRTTRGQTSTTQNPKNWLTVRLCHFAMTSNALTWDESAEAKPYRDEALRRKLTVIDCRKAMGFPVATAPQ